MKVIDTITRTSVTLVVIALLTITATAQDKLLITEIVVTPTAGEFIEIYNPGGAAVDLTNYYLTDATFAGGPTYYYQVVWGPDSAGVRGGGGGFGDFNARFPASAMIAAGEFQTVALNGAVNFNTEYGENPTYELYDTDAAVPDMLEADMGSINGQGGLSTGEVAVLYYWDGLTDLVTDVDYVVWQDLAEAVDKTGISIDGPDADATTTAYADDTPIASQEGAPTHSSGFSMQRIDFTEGSQLTSGSNGIGGADETSENLGSTWHADATPTPNAAPEPVILKLLISEFVMQPGASEFIEIYNPSGIVVDLTNVYLTDATFQNGNTYYYQVVWGPDSLGVRGGGGGFGDFNARFPSGASIAADEFQTIALNGSADFFAAFGVNPTYELYDTDAAIPDMLEADTAGSIGGQGGLSSNEVIILYYWDGMSDLVTDLDYLNYGGNDEQVDKTGVMIDGPDADATTSAYLADVAWADQDQALAHGLGLSTQRIDFSEGSQTMFGGNGVGGSDETSEDWSVTFHADSTATPNEAPQVIVVPLITKLLLTEFVNTPTAGEFVEFHNPGDSTVDLTSYYLTDATFAGGNTYYYQVVSSEAGVQGGGGGFADWNAKFPDGASIDPGEYQTVALNGSDDFFAEYGVAPTYELYEDSSAADSIPDMMEADTGSINGQGALSTEEVIILYFWDGMTDLVTDIDYVVWGDKAEAVDKSGVEIDGPDAGSDSSAYANDVAVADQDVAPTPSFGFSAQRIDMDEGIQVQGGSNGVAGASETSENFRVTWYAMATPTPNDPHNVDYVDMTIAEMEVDANGDFQPDRLGQMVRIHGVISTPNLQTNNTSHYLDDGTAGTDMFYFLQDSIFYMGDSVVIEGVVEFFAGVSEIIPPNKGAAVTVLSTDAEIRVQTIPVATINDVVGEDVEGEIVALDEPVSLVDEAAWPGGASSIDLFITNGPDTVKMRLDSDIGMGGDPRPCGDFWLTGVVSQFAFNNPPNDNYSVIPRGYEDMVLLDAAVITAADDAGTFLDLAFTASPRDTAGAADAITNYEVFAFFDDGTDSLLGTVNADNSAQYMHAATNPAQDAYIVVIANSAAGCGLWSERFRFEKIVGIADEKLIPEAYSLSANYPNPFNPTTKINYQLKENTQVKIVVFNLLGEQVAVLVDREQTAGVYSTEWNGLSDSRKVLASGIYFYRMTAGDFTKTNKMILLK